MTGGPGPIWAPMPRGSGPADSAEAWARPLNWYRLELWKDARPGDRRWRARLLLGASVVVRTTLCRAPGVPLELAQARAERWGRQVLEGGT